MTEYEQQIAAVVNARRDEVEADLTLARTEFEHAQKAHDHASQTLREAEDRVRTFAHLIALADRALGKEPQPETEARTTLHEAMRKVLLTAPERRMLAAELATRIDRRGLYKMRDGRKVEAQQVHARVGHYPELFEREGTFIKLK